MIYHTLCSYDIHIIIIIDIHLYRSFVLCIRNFFPKKSLFFTIFQKCMHGKLSVGNFQQYATPTPQNI